MEGFYDPDDVGTYTSPRFKPVIPRLWASPLPHFEKFENESFISDDCMLDEVDFSLQSRPHSEYGDSRPVASRQDAVLLNLLGGGEAVEVARTAATQLLVSDDEMSLDGSGIDRVELRPVAPTALKAPSNEDHTPVVLELPQYRMRQNSPNYDVTEGGHELEPSRELSLKAEKSNGNGSSSSETLSTDQSSPCPAGTSPGGERMIISGIEHPPIGSFQCSYPRCSARPFQTLDLLNSHTNAHSNWPYYCSVKGCSRGEGRKGFKRKSEMIRHNLIHESPYYVCPYCQDQEHNYPRPDNLLRHVRVHHVNRDKDDPLLIKALSQRHGEGRRRLVRNRYDVAMQTTVDNQHSGCSQIGIVNLRPSLDLGKMLRGEMSDRWSRLGLKAIVVEPQHIPPTQVNEFSSINYTEANKSGPVLRRENNSVELTYNELDSPSLNVGDSEPRQVAQHFIGTIDDVPFTDSGYSSLRNNLYHPSTILPSPKKTQCTTTTEQSISINNIDTDDAQTSYSAATTIGPAYAQHYITELCADIYSKLQQCFDGKFWSILSRALPMLIKAFAIKIGHDASTQVNQEIMYFLHRRHDQIFAQLEAMFQQKDGAIPNSPQTERSCMSLNEKMSLWNSKAGEDQSVIKIDELYLGVKDDEEEITDQVDLPTYHKIILNSAAYEWFLANLRKEIALQWSATQPCVMVESIRQRILDKLPTGTISKRRALSGHEVKFEIQWDNKSQQGLKYEDFEQLIKSKLSFAEEITVTGSVEEAQALTIEHYLSQTWPVSGPRLFDVLQNTINSRYYHYSVTLLDNTQLEARIYGSYLSIKATGPAHFIAECAEQLAWLQAALCSNCPNHVTYCTPSIASYFIIPSRSEKLKYEGHCKMSVEVAHPETLGDSVLSVQNCWQDLVGSNLIIAGFPISRRPENYLGLELSFDTFLRLLKADKTITAYGSVLLKGQNKTVQLVEHNDNIFLWHPFHNERQGCSCRSDRRVEFNAVVYNSTIDHHLFNAGRHIFSDCEDFHTSIGKNMKINDLSEILDSSKATDAQNRVSAETNPLDSLRLNHNQPTIIQNENVPVLPMCQNSVTTLTSSITSIGDHLASANSLPTFQENCPETGSLSGDTNSLAAESQPVIATGSPNNSIDSEFLSLSDSSEEMKPLDSNEATCLLLDNLMQELLSGFRSITQYQQSPGENSERSAMESTATTDIICNSTQYPKRKRKLKDDDEIDEDDFRKPPRKRINPNQGKALQTTLACPYLKLDSVTYRKCCKYQLSRIRDVKQHLERQHTPKFYCQTCFKTDFLDQQSLQRHVDLRTCPSNDPMALDGISNHQRWQLSRKSNRGLSEEDQWFAIWTILFPGVQRPLSAYVDFNVSEDIRLFREYSLAHGPAVLREQLESNPALFGTDITIEQRQILNKAISQGIDSLFEEYLLIIPHPDLIRDQRASSSRQLNRIETLTSSNADSGMALESQLSSSATMSQRDPLDQTPSNAEFNYHMAAANIRVQDTTTTHELIAGPPQSREQNMLDPPLDHYFDDQFLDVEEAAFDPALGFDWSMFENI